MPRTVRERTPLRRSIFQMSPPASVLLQHAPSPDLRPQAVMIVPGPRPGPDSCLQAMTNDPRARPDPRVAPVSQFTQCRTPVNKWDPMIDTLTMYTPTMTMTSPTRPLVSELAWPPLLLAESTWAPPTQRTVAPLPPTTILGRQDTTTLMD